MSTLQSWLLLVVVFIVLMITMLVIFTLVGAIVTIVNRWRDYRATQRFRAKLALNAAYGKRYNVKPEPARQCVACRHSCLIVGVVNDCTASYHHARMWIPTYACPVCRERWYWMVSD